MFVDFVKKKIINFEILWLTNNIKKLRKNSVLVLTNTAARIPVPRTK